MKSISAIRSLFLRRKTFVRIHNFSNRPVALNRHRGPNGQEVVDVMFGQFDSRASRYGTKPQTLTIE